MRRIRPFSTEKAKLAISNILAGGRFWKSNIISYHILKWRWPDPLPVASLAESSSDCREWLFNGGYKIVGVGQVLEWDWLLDRDHDNLQVHRTIKHQQTSGWAGAEAAGIVKWSPTLTVPTTAHRGRCHREKHWRIKVQQGGDGEDLHGNQVCFRSHVNIVDLDE